MSVKECIISEQTNNPMIGIVYDAITGAYLMTDVESKIGPDDWNDCISVLTNKTSLATLDARLDAAGMLPRPYRATIDGVEQIAIDNRSGRALFSSLFPEDFYYKKGEVLIKNGILVSGRITKDHIGRSHGSIIQVLFKEYGRDRTVDFLTDCPFIVNRYLESRGFSVGLSDCAPPDDELRRGFKRAAMETQVKVAAMGTQLTDPFERERNERQIVGEINKLKDATLRVARDQMSENNSLRIMASDIGGGAKGAPSNITQITGLLGQQFIGGQRLPQTISGGTRCLPYFPENDPSIEARGFCVNSFLQGMTPSELFFHQAGGREGLLDTATKTADTGALSHLLVKALEDLRVTYTGSVTNSNGVIFTMAYGSGDGCAGDQLIRVSSKTGPVAAFIDLKNLAAKINVRSGFAPSN